jgi:hypothetical protein
MAYPLIAATTGLFTVWFAEFGDNGPEFGGVREAEIEPGVEFRAKMRSNCAPGAHLGGNNVWIQYGERGPS